MINFHRENSNEDLPSNINVEQFSKWYKVAETVLYKKILIFIFSESIPSKRITITLVGTRGDVQPFIALALKLQEFGHKVKIATHKLHQPFVESYNIAFAPISGDPRELIKLCVTNDTFSLKFIREANKHFRSFMQDIIYTCWEACKSDTEVLIENPPCKSHFQMW
jgi:sterol 3beta-glucosyltransferase